MRERERRIEKGKTVRIIVNKILRQRKIVRKMARRKKGSNRENEREKDIQREIEKSNREIIIESEIEILREI